MVKYYEVANGVASLELVNKLQQEKEVAEEYLAEPGRNLRLGMLPSKEPEANQQRPQGRL